MASETAAAPTSLLVNAQGEAQVGFGQASIAPPFPLESAYGRPEPHMEFYDRGMFAKALVFKVQEAEVALVVFDLIGMGKAAAQRIQGEIASQTGMEAARVLVSCTHSHSSPRLREGNYLDFVAGQAVAAVKQARAALFPARIGFGRGHIDPHWTVNRHHNNPTTVVNTEIMVMRVDDASGQPRAILFNFGSHPTAFTTSWNDRDIGKYGADWPGYARRWIEATWALKDMIPAYAAGKDSPELFTVFALGAAGDQQVSRDPEDPADTDSDLRTREEFIAAVGSEVLRVAEEIKTSSLLSLRLLAKQVNIPVGESRPTGHRGGVYAPEVGMLLLNEAAFAFIPGELNADLGREFEQASGAKYPFLITLAGDSLGYLTNEAEAYEAMSYEGKGSALGPQRGRLIIDTAISLANPSYTPRPPLDPEKDLGRLEGRIVGDEVKGLIVGLSADTLPPGDLERFFGRRTHCDDQGRFLFEGLAPGLKFLYLRKPGAAPEEPPRTLLYAHPVEIQAGRSTRVELPMPSLRHSLVSLAIDKILEERGAVRGRLKFSGHLAPDENIYGAIYRREDIKYSWGGTYYLAQPLARAAIDASGEFRFPRLAPGRYLCYFWYDVNGNGRPEPGVDLTTGFSRLLVVSRAH